MRLLLQLLCCPLLAAPLLSCEAGAIKGSQSGVRQLVAPIDLPQDVRIGATDIGPRFTDAAGMTLYFSTDDDRPGQSYCNSTRPAPTNDSEFEKSYAAYSMIPTCTQQRPPLIASPGAAPVGDWSIIQRSDGRSQWAYLGHPIHRSYKDLLPGDVNGDEESWSAVAPPLSVPPGVTMAWKNGIGMVARRATGSLYTLRTVAKVSSRWREIVAVSNCSDACAQRWQPVVAAELANPFGPWGVISHEDGSRQWTFHGQPLVTFSGDHEPGDTNGLATGEADLVLLERNPQSPAAIKTQFTLLGTVYTDTKGMTLYSFDCQILPFNAANRHGVYSCNGPGDDYRYAEQYCPALDRCIEMWRPVEAPAKTRPRGGMWSVAMLPDPERYPLRWQPWVDNAPLPKGAVKVWTFKGLPIYTSTRDHEPGDFNAHYIRQVGGVIWKAVMASDFEPGAR